MTKQKWQKLSLVEQLANIGSEFNRVLYWQKVGDMENKERAAWRVLELLDLTISDKRWQKRLSELVRLREVICDFFLGERIYNISPKKINDYFLSFALVARK